MSLLFFTSFLNTKDPVRFKAAWFHATPFLLFILAAGVAYELELSTLEFVAVAISSRLLGDAFKYYFHSPAIKAIMKESVDFAKSCDAEFLLFIEPKGEPAIDVCVRHTDGTTEKLSTILEGDKECVESFFRYAHSDAALKEFNVFTDKVIEGKRGDVHAFLLTRFS